MTTFENASGNNDLDSMLKGLSRSARAGLLQEIHGVHFQVKTHVKGVGPEGYQAPDKIPLLRDTPDQALAQLAKSLSETAPEEVKPLVNLITIVSPPHGIQIAGMLQRRGESPCQLGITFEITDLAGQQAPKIFSIWEPGVQSTKSPDSQAASGAGTSTPPIAQQTQLYNVGIALDSIGHYQEAIGYYEEALRLDPTSSIVAQALAASLSKQQIQITGISAYTSGKKLQELGLIDLAIENYVKPLPLADQLSAQANWEVALGRATGNVGDAFLALAQGYRKVWLFDQSLEQYEAAIRHGSAPAVNEIANIRHEIADAFTQASKVLLELGRFTTAEQYLSTALDSVPDYPPAQVVLATLKQYKPVQEDKKALALFELGQIYLERGAVQQAKSYYEEALKQDPTYTDAKHVLQRLLAQEQTLSERYIALIDPSMRWLALEISRDEMLTKIPWRYRFEQRKNYEGRVHNFSGALFLASGLTFPNYGQFFFQLAYDYLQKARDLLPNSYQPYENLADTCSYWGHSLDGEAALDLYRESLIWYQKALSRAQQANEKRVLNVGAAMVKLLLKDAQFSAEANKDIADIETDPQWERASERNARLLYNLATWYALAHKHNIGLPDSDKEARRYLAYSLARDSSLFDPAANDSDLVDIIGGLSALKFQLSDESNSGLDKKTGTEFVNAMQAIMKKAKWLP
jgi:tetratricopeptide (TPR) repeat protein